MSVPRCPRCGEDAVLMPGMDEWLLSCHPELSAVVPGVEEPLDGEWCSCQPKDTGEAPDTPAYDCPIHGGTG